MDQGTGHGTLGMKTRGPRGSNKQEDLPPLTSQPGKASTGDGSLEGSDQTYEETEDVRRNTSEERG